MPRRFLLPLVCLSASVGALLVLVIGGSMSGLLAGLVLRRAGWAVDIYERVESELSGRGAGIVAQQELIVHVRGRRCLKYRSRQSTGGCAAVALATAAGNRFIASVAIP